jgi:hypothetical protein
MIDFDHKMIFIKSSKFSCCQSTPKSGQGVGFRAGADRGGVPVSGRNG